MWDAISRGRSGNRLLLRSVAMRNVFAGLMVAIGLFCGVTLAQNAQREVQPAQPGAAQPRPAVAPRQPVQPGQPGQPGQQLGQQGQPGTADQQIAACVYGACKNEIELAKFAESKAKTDEVREFAQRMVR